MTAPQSVEVIAHIGNIPVEEWAPFLAPVLRSHFLGCRNGRRRRAAVERLPDLAAALDEHTTTLVMDDWSKSSHRELTRAHLPLLYPPGSDGRTARELARRIHADPGGIELLLEELAEYGYLEFDPASERVSEARVWLTVKGHDLVEDREGAPRVARRLACGSRRATRRLIGWRRERGGQRGARVRRCSTAAVSIPSSQPRTAAASTIQTSETCELPNTQLTLACAVLEAASAITTAASATVKIA